MYGETKNLDWNEIENGMVMQWYHVSKIMHCIIPKTFSAIKFQGIFDQIREDPNFKKTEEN